MAFCPCTRAIDRSSQTGYQSLPARTSLAHTRSGQSERRGPLAPIRTPEWPKVNSAHTAARHAFMRTPPLNIADKAVFSEYNLLVSLIRLWPYLGGSRRGWRLFVEQTDALHKQHVRGTTWNIVALKTVLRHMTDRRVLAYGALKTLYLVLSRHIWLPSFIKNSH